MGLINIHSKKHLHKLFEFLRFHNFPASGLDGRYMTGETSLSKVEQRYLILILLVFHISPNALAAN